MSFMGASLFAQQTKSLDNAILEAGQNIETALPQGSKAAVLNFTSSSDRFSHYVVEELMNYLTNRRKLDVVDRQRLDLIFNEQKFQTSGYVSDESMQSIGNMLGAQFIVTGGLEEIGTAYRFRVYAMNVEKAVREVSYAVDLSDSEAKIASLLGKKSVSAQPSDALNIGDIGPGGGLVFYKSGRSYMEVRRVPGSYNWKNAQEVAERSSGGYSNWYLPSKDELNLIYQSGVIRDSSNYWSSTPSGLLNAWDQRFNNGRQGSKGDKKTERSVLAIRSFNK
jgi:TolB-like protein